MSQSILLAGANANRLYNLQKRFQQSGYMVYLLESDIRDNNKNHIPNVDILITFSHNHLRGTLQHWRKKWDNNAPLVVLLYDQDYRNGDYHDGDDELLNIEDIDIILSLQSPFLEQQIIDSYRLHQRNRALYIENQLLQAELLKQTQTINEFEILKNAIVRNISHELKTPLLQVKSAVALLSEETDSKLITYATNATAKLEILIKNITMLGSSLDINLIPIIPRDVVESAKRNILRVWEHKDAESRIKLNLSENLDPVMADKQGLNTVLQLLLDNALKFSDKVVEVHVETSGDFIVFRIVDYGIGIESSKLHEIFDLFVQIDSSSTRRYGGAGVGLPLVKLILDHHHSKINVRSHIGNGSEFSFKLRRMNIKQVK